MGILLARNFDIAKERGGIEAQVKLAMLTKMSCQMALNAPDSPDNIKLFKESINKIPDTKKGA